MAAPGASSAPLPGLFPDRRSTELGKGRVRFPSPCPSQCQALTHFPGLEGSKVVWVWVVNKTKSLDYWYRAPSGTLLALPTMSLCARPPRFQDWQQSHRNLWLSSSPTETRDAAARVQPALSRYPIPIPILLRRTIVDRSSYSSRGAFLLRATATTGVGAGDFGSRDWPRRFWLEQERKKKTRLLFATE